MYFRTMKLRLHLSAINSPTKKETKNHLQGLNQGSSACLVASNIKHNITSRVFISGFSLFVRSLGFTLVFIT